MNRNALLAVLVPLLSWSQSAPVFRVDVNLLTLPCVITDADGKTVTDLSREEFRVFDNGAPQKILNIWRDADLPLTVGVIMDVSQSQRAFFQEHRATVTRFLERIIRAQDRGFVVRADDKVVLEAEFIGRSDGIHQLLLPTVGRPLGEPCPTVRGRSLCGGTELWDAVFSSARYKLRKLKGNKALVILSDGNDTGSIHTLNEAVTEVQRANTVVYAIGYPDSSPSGQPPEGLLRLSHVTGGLKFDPPHGNIDTILDRVEADLRSQYVLGFAPDRVDADSRSHELRVEVTRPGMIVRARREYISSLNEPF